jgi:hypothetical protein
MSIDYARMTNPQRWQWHAQVYAVRRVVLGVPHDEHTSPCDTKGEWFDARAAAQAEAALRAKLAEQSNRCQADTEARNAIRYAEADAWRKQRERGPEPGERGDNRGLAANSA